MGSWQFAVIPTGQRQNGIRLIVVKQYLLVILVIVVYALLVADVVAVGRRGADLWLAVSSDFPEERGQPPSIASRRKIPSTGRTTPAVWLSNGYAGTG